MIEKPLATELHESARVLAAIEHAGVDAVVGYTQRFRRRFLVAKEKVRTGQLGDVTLVGSHHDERRLALSPEHLVGAARRVAGLGPQPGDRHRRHRGHAHHRRHPPRLWGLMREETTSWFQRLALGQPTPHATAAEAHNRLMLTKALDLSARRRRPVALPITPEDETA